MPPVPPRLQDRFGRTIEYLRVSVTERCDLRCSYCASTGVRERAELDCRLGMDEVVRVVAAFARMGAGRVRLTGGEPLTRRDLPALAARLAAAPGVRDLALSTNATRLADCASALKTAGVTRLNVSLDSLRRDRFAQIVGRDCLSQVLSGLMAAKAEGFSPIKINMVALRGVNDDEIDDMVDFCLSHGFVLRLIEAMPMGESGRSAGYLDLQPVRRRLQARFGLVDGVVPGAGPARYLQTPDGTFSVGFITPISQHFCATCNRVRLSATGTLYLCLGQEVSVELRPLLRGGASDEALEAALREAIELKPERQRFRDAPTRIDRMMRKTGG